jgi:hypothetical protein
MKKEVAVAGTSRPRIAIWPFSTPTDLRGETADAFQGVYSRGLCKAFADGLLRTKACDVGVCLPVVDYAGLTSWVVSGAEWTQNEALAVGLPQGTDLLMFGTMRLREVVELHCMVVAKSSASVLLDHRLIYPREKLLDCLSDVVSLVAKTIVGRPLTLEEAQKTRLWGTHRVEAYLAYLETWSAAAAFRFGVSVPNPSGPLECAVRAVNLDPDFAQTKAIHEALVAGRKNVDGRIPGYSEFAYPLAREAPGEKRCQDPIP